MERVFVSYPLDPELLRPLTECCVVDVWEREGPVPADSLRSAVASASGLLSMITDLVDVRLLEHAPALRVVSQMAVGVDNIDVAACHARGVRVGHTPDVLTETVADTAFALLAASIRRLPEGWDVVRSGRWGPWDPGFLLGGDLHRLVLGIIGMGRIGQALARRARGFDMEILFTGRSPHTEDGAQQVSLDRLLSDSDAVVVCAPLTDETHHLIGRRELVAMKASAHLVNIARGGLVDTDALVEALGAGIIAGAALDVTDPEPLPASHPLATLPNCLIVPHIGSASHRTRRAMAELAVANLRAGILGDEMPAEVSAGRATAHPDYPLA